MADNDSLKNQWITSPKPVYEATGPSWIWLAGVALIFGILIVSRVPMPESLPAVSSVKVDNRWDFMVSNIDQLVGSYDGEVGVFIKDLKTGRTYAHNADERFVSASLIKLPIMAATFEAIHSGKISLNTRLTYKRGLRREGSGSLKWARVGARYPISYLIYAMITHSDNTATAMVIDLLGYEYLNKKFSDFGLQVLHIAPTGMSLASRLDPSLDNFTTAREMGMLLEKIYNHQIVNDGLSDLMLEIMKGANSRTRLARYLPPDWKFARKTGLLRKNCHDVGIVFSPEGDYILCVMTGQNRTYENAKGLIASVGRQTYAYIEPAS